MDPQLTQEAIDLFKTAFRNGELRTDFTKAGWTQPGSATTGMQEYSLEAPAKLLFPVLTPLRNAIPRVGGGRSIQANWRAITALNANNVPATVPEGLRGGVVTTTEVDYLAAFRTIGLEDKLTFEAVNAAQGFVDLQALAASNLLKSTMIAEESLLLGGQGTWALGTTPTPTGALVSGGSMTAAATFAYCVALTLDGYKRATVAGGVATTVSVLAAGPYGGTTVINAGQAAISAASAGVTTTGGTLSIRWSVAAVPGAFAYAWFTGATGIGNAHLAGITSVNTFLQTADAAGTQAANAAGLSTDHSQNSLAFDGLVAIGTKSGSNGYYRSLDGAALTFDSAGGSAEIDTALAAFWGSASSGNLRLGPTDMWVSPLDIMKFSKGVFAGSIFKVDLPIGGAAGGFQSGGMITNSYLNKITGSAMRIHPHPDLPSGKIVFTTSELPYPLSGVQSVMRVLTRAEYRSYDWPLVQRQYEYGVYVDEVLQHYFPPSIGIIDNAVLA